MQEHKCVEQVDYRNMYYHMAAEMEKAIRLLIAAQRACEDMPLGEESEANAQDDH